MLIMSTRGQKSVTGPRKLPRVNFFRGINLDFKEATVALATDL